MICQTFICNNKLPSSKVVQFCLIQNALTVAVTLLRVKVVQVNKVNISMKRNKLDAYIYDHYSCIVYLPTAAANLVPLSTCTYSQYPFNLQLAFSQKRLGIS
jgi:hypothetical protein